MASPPLPSLLGLLCCLSAAAARSDPNRYVPVPGGLSMPVLNLGTGSGQHGDVANATALWIGVGGVGIDTALHYEDEAAIAAGIAAAKADPASLFITSKIPCATYATATADIKSNLKQLGVDKVSPIWKEGALRGVLPSPSRLLAFSPSPVPAVDAPSPRMWRRCTSMCRRSGGVQACEPHRDISH